MAAAAGTGDEAPQAILPPFTLSVEEMQKRLMTREGKTNWHDVPFQTRANFDFVAGWTRLDVFPLTRDATKVLAPIVTRCVRISNKYYHQRNDNGLKLPALEAFLLWMDKLPIFNTLGCRVSDTDTIPLHVPNKVQIERAKHEVAVRTEFEEKKDFRFLKVLTEVERLFRAISYMAKHVIQQRAYRLGEDVECPTISVEWIDPDPRKDD